MFTFTLSPGARETDCAAFSGRGRNTTPTRSARITPAAFVSDSERPVSPTVLIQDTGVRFPGDTLHTLCRLTLQTREITVNKNFLKLALPLHVYRDMSVLRTMSLIAGGALIALGGSALALFL